MKLYELTDEQKQIRKELQEERFCISVENHSEKVARKVAEDHAKEYTMQCEAGHVLRLETKELRNRYFGIVSAKRSESEMNELKAMVKRIWWGMKRMEELQ